MLRRSRTAVQSVLLSGILRGRVEDRQTYNAFRVAESSDSASTPVKAIAEQPKADLPPSELVSELVRRHFTTPLVMEHGPADSKMKWMNNVEQLAFGSPDFVNGCEAVQIVGGKATGLATLVAPAFGSAALAKLKYAVVFGTAEGGAGWNVVDLSGAKLTSKNLGNESSCFVDAELSGNAVVQIGPAGDEAQVLARRYLSGARVEMAATAVSVLRQAAKITNLHSMTTTSYGKLLSDTQFGQGRIATLETSIYSIEAFASSVRGALSDSADGATLDSVLLKLFISSRSKDALGRAYDAVHPWATNNWANDSRKVTLGEKEVTINYGNLNECRDALFALETLDGVDGDLVEDHITPLFKSAPPVSGNGLSGLAKSLPGPLKNLVAKEGDVLTNPHINLVPSLDKLGADIAAFPSVIAKGTAGKLPPVLQKNRNALVSLYAAELLASVAVAHRASADLDNAEEAAANRSWLLAQASLGVSAGKRASMLRQLNAISATPKTLRKSAAEGEAYPEMITSVVEVGRRKAITQAKQAAMKAAAASSANQKLESMKKKE